MRIKFILSIITVLLFFKAHSQSNNAVYFEILGNGGLYSLNYDHSLNVDLKLRLGAAYSHISDRYIGDNGLEVYSVPLLISYLKGANKHKLEVSGGGLFGIENYHSDHGGEFILNLTAFAGYRYEATKGFLFRVGITPFYNVVGNPNYIIDGFFVSGGISLGYHF
jgi:hypothetical protein